jgi:hypothetical protein
MVRSLLSLGLFVLLCGVPVLAQDYEEEERDLLELVFYGGAGIPGSGVSDWSDTLGAKTGFTVGLDFGYFLSPELVLGLSFSYLQFEVDTDSEANALNHRFFNPSLYLKYYFFTEGNLAPFVKAHAGVDNAKFATFVGQPSRFRELSYDPAFSFGIGGGLMYYTSDYSGLYLEVDYHQAMTENVAKTYQDTEFKFGSNSGLVNLRAGIAIYFGGS